MSYFLEPDQQTEAPAYHAEPQLVVRCIQTIIPTPFLLLTRHVLPDKG